MYSTLAFQQDRLVSCKRSLYTVKKQIPHDIKEENGNIERHLPNSLIKKLNTTASED